MDTNTWLWIGLIVLLVLCCGPMLFMRRHADHSGHPRSDDRVGSSDRR